MSTLYLDTSALVKRYSRSSLLLLMTTCWQRHVPKGWPLRTPTIIPKRGPNYGHTTATSID